MGGPPRHSGATQRVAPDPKGGAKSVETHEHWQCKMERNGPVLILNRSCSWVPARCFAAIGMTVRQAL
jgi:hypothetical protein